MFIRLQIISGSFKEADLNSFFDTEMNLLWWVKKKILRSNQEPLNKASKKMLVKNIS